MLDPSLQSINRVIIFPLSHLSSFLYLFLVQTVFFFERPPNMDSYPSTRTSKFVELLNSQQTVSFGNFEDSVELSPSQVSFRGSVGTEASKFYGDSVAERREQRILISSWLNTNKDPVVGNEQKFTGFWKRIAAYFAASPLVSGCEEREAAHCKQRWHRINDLVSKFCGAYEAAIREKN
uniref:Myb-like domain-containing protein n=1 Tax=Brassica oleracea var. oleracea TaxID=109376 RepID=A0A0D3CUX9_BRAOL